MLPAASFRDIGYGRQCFACHGLQLILSDQVEDHREPGRRQLRHEQPLHGRVRLAPLVLQLGGAGRVLFAAEVDGGGVEVGGFVDLCGF